MKPVRLTLKNFGSYRDEIVIDFTKMGDKGLFLIYGDNGAGKSTIYDAISYSLYGKASGDNRYSPDMLRNTAALETEETFTELVFTHLGQEYKVRRSMKYKRPSLRGTGLTDQPGDTVLTLPNGEKLVKAKADKEIEKILGVQVEQFKQIMMIAQGAFSRFLFADSNEKKKILGTIFNTDKFEKLQDVLKEQLSNASKDRNECLAGLNTDCRRISLPEKEELDSENEETETAILEVVESLRELIGCLGESTVQDTLPRIKELLDEMIDLDTEAIAKIDTDLGLLSKKKEGLDQRYGAAEKVKQAKEGLKKAEDFVQANSVKLTDLETASKETKAKNDAVIGQNQTQIGGIRGTLDDYQKLDDSKKTLIEAEKQINKETSNKEQFKSKLADRNKEKESHKQRESELNDILQNGSSKARDAEVCKGKLEKIDEALKIGFQMAAKQNELSTAQTEFTESQKEYAAAERESKHLEDLFLKGQAGILAESLEEGLPCPVCGSCDHPAKAVKHADMPTEAELRKAQEETNRLQEIRRDKSEKAGLIQGICEAKRSELLAKASELLGKEISEPQEAVSALGDLKTAVQNEAKKIQDELDALEAARKEYSQLTKTKIPECEQQICNLEKQIQAVELNLKTYENSKDTASLTIKELEPKLKHPSRKEAEAEISKLEKLNLELNNQTERAKKEYDQLNTEMTAAKGSIVSLNEQLKGTKDEDLDDLKKRVDEIRKELDRINSQRGKRDSRNKNNTNVKKFILEDEIKFKEKDNEYKKIEPLSRAANGKLAFSSYVLASYLDQIMFRTNKILSRLSDRFVLQRKESETDGRRSYGLDLTVTNTHTGKEQETKSLSGGEAFMVSLALALGFAEEVREAAQGAKMESMFIDEGFGTLSEENIGNAVRLLSELAGNEILIGVISHVGTVMDGIPKRIHVTRENSWNSGSKVSIEA